MEQHVRRLKNSSFTAQDICAILKAASDASVFEMQLGDLFVRFGGPAPLAELAIAQSISANAIAEESRAEIQKTFEKEAVLDKEDKLALMAIEDPMEYERLIMSGELEDARQPGDGEENEEG